MNGMGCPLAVHHWADLQSVHGSRCYDNIQHTDNAYSAKREMSASACVRCMAGFSTCYDLLAEC